MASRREHRGRQKRPSRTQRRRRQQAHLRVPEPEITLPFRRTEPDTVVAHVGPTNSGKTHSALQFLAETGRGVFAAPLRMLAQEAHRRLSAQLGAECVGLVTGEERVNEHAPIICCTAEMAPLSGEVLVLDEVQWADDVERGSAWTRLLLAGEYRHILLLGAVEALPLIQNAFPQVEVRFFERKAPLDWTGEVSFQSLTPGTVVVAFSRRAVLALAGELNRRRPGEVAVLYGAMPLPSRRLEIERFMTGKASVCCATDVLGHGVNLPCETLLFAETQKFDGEERRDLHAWEIAQIAGRAGRFGLVERGHVGVLRGIVWANADPELVRSALVPHVRLPGGHMGYRIVDTARLRPRLEDLPVESAAAAVGRPARLAHSRVAPVGDGQLALGRVDRAAARAARRGAATTARARSETLARAGLEARQRPCRRGQRRAALDARARTCRRPGAAAGARVAARHEPPA